MKKPHHEEALANILWYDRRLPEVPRYLRHVLNVRRLLEARKLAGELARDGLCLLKQPYQYQEGLPGTPVVAKVNYGRTKYVATTRYTGERAGDPAPTALSLEATAMYHRPHRRPRSQLRCLYSPSTNLPTLHEIRRFYFKLLVEPK